MVFLGDPPPREEVGAASPPGAPALNVSSVGAIAHSNWTEVVKSGVVPESVLVNKAALAMLLSAQPYEPKGWSGVINVMLFGFVLFVPVAATIALRYCSGPKPRRQHQRGLVRELQSKLMCILSSFANTSRHALTSIVYLETTRSHDLALLGAEATFFLATQRESARLLFLLAIIACAVLLPLHLYAGTEHVSNEFSESTVQHLSKHSLALWVHTVFPFVATALYLRFVQKCRGHLSWVWQRGVQGARDDDLWETTVLVRGIRKHLRETDVCRVLAAVYPGEVQGVAMVLDTTRALQLKRSRQRKQAALRMRLTHLKARNEQPSANNDAAGWHDLPRLPPTRTCLESCFDAVVDKCPCCCSCFILSRISTAHLAHEVKKLRLEIESLKQAEASITPATSRSSGIAFVTFYSRRQAHELVNLSMRKTRIGYRLDELARLTREDATDTTSRSIIHGDVEIAHRRSSSSSSSGEGSGIGRSTATSTGDNEDDETAPPTDDEARAQSLPLPEAHRTRTSSTHSSIFLVDDNQRSARALVRSIVDMRMSRWKVRFSPDPHDLLWRTMHVTPATYWTRTILVNLTIVATLVVLTTPVALFMFISSLSEKDTDNVVLYSFATLLDDVRELPGPLGDFLCSFMPQILLLSINALLVRFVQALTKRWEPHMTRSGQQASILRKTFWFLLFNTLLLPSLALSSLGDFIDDLVEHAENPFALLGQVFVVSSGAFTLCYVITSTWVGSAVDLVSLWDAWVWGRRQLCKLMCCWRTDNNSTGRGCCTSHALHCNCCYCCCPGVGRERRQGFIHEQLPSAKGQETAAEGGEGGAQQGQGKCDVGSNVHDKGGRHEGDDDDDDALPKALNSSSSSSSSDTVQGDSAPTFAHDFGGEYAVWLTLIALSIVFAGMVPVILPFAGVYFVVHTAVLNFKLTWQATHTTPVRSARPRIGRVAVRHLALPLLLYQAATIGYFSSYVCVPGQVLLWNGWGVANLDAKLVWKNVQRDGTLLGNSTAATTTAPPHSPASLIEFTSSSSSSSGSEARKSGSGSAAVLEEVLTTPDGYIVKPCLDGRGVPGTLALRGSLGQLLVLYALCVATTVYVVLRHIGERSSQEQDDWALRVSPSSPGHPRRQRRSKRPSDDWPSPTPHLASDEDERGDDDNDDDDDDYEEDEEEEADDEHASLLRSKQQRARSGSRGRERGELSTTAPSPQEVLAHEQTKRVRVAMVDVVEP